MLLSNSYHIPPLVVTKDTKLESYQKVKFSCKKGRGCANPLPTSGFIHKTVKLS